MFSPNNPTSHEKSFDSNNPHAHDIIVHSVHEHHFRRQCLYDHVMSPLLVHGVNDHQDIPQLCEDSPQARSWPQGWCPHLCYCRTGVSVILNGCIIYGMYSGEEHDEKMILVIIPHWKSMSMRFPEISRVTWQLWWFQHSLWNCPAPVDRFSSLGLILGLCPANEKQRYFVTKSLIGWAQA